MASRDPSGLPFAAGCHFPSDRPASILKPQPNPPPCPATTAGARHRRAGGAGSPVPTPAPASFLVTTPNTAAAAEAAQSGKGGSGGSGGGQGFDRRAEQEPGAGSRGPFLETRPHETPDRRPRRIHQFSGFVRRRPRTTLTATSQSRIDAKANKYLSGLSGSVKSPAERESGPASPE